MSRFIVVSHRDDTVRISIGRDVTVTLSVADAWELAREIERAADVASLSDIGKET